MQIQENVSLARFSAMRLGGTAAYVSEVRTRQDAIEAAQWAAERRLPLIVIGAGSNIVWRDEGFSGLVVVNRITGYEDLVEDKTNHYVTIGAGEIWDNVVEHSVADGLTGIEALSLIPGTAGATPVQNVGAYGQDISQTLVSIEAYDLHEQKIINIPNELCAFGYRTSRFKTADRGRFLITGITLHLLHGNPQPPFYPALQSYLDEHDRHSFTPQVVRDAVVAIRQAKLPDVAVVANNGSFFANPVVSEGDLAQLEVTYPNIPHWPVEQGAKIPAAWLLEQAGFKNVHDVETGMATWPSQPLVLVNEHAKSTADLLKFKQKITDSVKNKFGITLEQEPELLP